jgi:hypothetical protein
VKAPVLFFALAIVVTGAFAQTKKMPESSSTATQRVTFGGGCFWCLEAVFQRLNGVKSVASGYAGGTVPNPLTNRSAKVTRATRKWCRSSLTPRPSVSTN